MKKTVIIQNLRCGGCVNTIKSNISTIEKVSKVDIDLDNSSITFNYQTEEDYKQVVEKLKSLGYPLIDGDNNLLTKTKSVLSCISGKVAN